MGNAYIFNEHLDVADRALIEKVIRVAGYIPVYDAFADVSLFDPAEDIGVVALPAAPEDTAAVNTGTRSLGGAGIRIVGIWLHGEEGGGIGVPDGIAKYGSTTVDIDSQELTDALQGDCDIWEGPGGIPNPAPNTKRNKC